MEVIIALGMGPGGMAGVGLCLERQQKGTWELGIEVGERGGSEMDWRWGGEPVYCVPGKKFPNQLPSSCVVIGN
jgi:hypothetical protein